MDRIMIISFLLLTIKANCFAQPKVKHNIDVLKGELKTRLSFLENYNRWTNQEFDAEKYSRETAILLIDFLKLTTLNNGTLAGFKNISLAAKANDILQVQIYDFSYHCGGSRGEITHPVIQWRGRNGVLHAYNLSEKINCAFNEIHKLKSTKGSFYLLLGTEKGNSSTIQNIAYVLKIDQNNISANYEAFINRSYVNLANADLSFDDKTQTLKCISSGENEKLTQHFQYIQPTGDSMATDKLIRMFYRQFTEPICLRFTGEKFIRQTKCP